MSSQEHAPDLTKIVQRIQETESPDNIRTIIDEFHPYDLGLIFFQLTDDKKAPFLSQLLDEEIAEVLKDLQYDEKKQVLETLDPNRTADVFNVMKSDDVADILGELQENENVELYLTEMQADEAAKVRSLLTYSEDTAGGLMTHEYVSVYNTFTVQQVIEHLRREAPTAETVYYVFVTEASGRLVGVVSLRQLLIAAPETPVENVMYERVISVSADTDQEEVARVLERYDFLAVPVVDNDERLLGIVTVDDIVDVIIEEAQEDISRLSAVGADDRTGITSPWSVTRRRLPWLVMLLFIGMLTATILQNFEATIEQVTALTYFMPMIAGMTGNTGTQSLAMVIQGLSMGNISRETVWKVLRREFAVAILIGTCCSILIALMALIWKGDLVLGIVVGSSLWFTLIVGTMAGTIIPLILNMLKVDPTAASGPLITTLNDIFSITIYFGIASFFLHLLIS